MARARATHVDRGQGRRRDRRSSAHRFRDALEVGADTALSRPDVPALRGYGFKANYFDVETGGYFWISGCRKDGLDALYSTDVAVDDHAREAYRLEIRGRPDLAHITSFRAVGKLTGTN